MNLKGLPALGWNEMRGLGALEPRRERGLPQIKATPAT